MSQADREGALKAFSQKPSIKVLLVSLMAGGFGLNLTSANHVFLMDPWWNASVESQAIDRVHRLGQTKDVHTYRFVTKAYFLVMLTLIQLISLIGFHRRKNIRNAGNEDQPLKPGIDRKS